MNRFIYLALATLFILTPLLVSAHPGRTDASGCHTCRTNCPNWGLDYGEYHCHNAKTIPQPIAPIKSTFGENGTGYTSPAPEYAAPKSGVNTYKPMVPATKNLKATSSSKTSSYNSYKYPVAKPTPSPKSWWDRVFSLFN